MERFVEKAGLPCCTYLQNGFLVEELPYLRATVGTTYTEYALSTHHMALPQRRLRKPTQRVKMPMSQQISIVPCRERVSSEMDGCDVHAVTLHK